MLSNRALKAAHRAARDLDIDSTRKQAGPPGSLMGNYFRVCHEKGHWPFSRLVLIWSGTIDRYLAGPVQDLAFATDKMAFVSGPRQSGKTTFARLRLKERAWGRYGNWDDVEFRRAWTQSPKALLPAPAEASSSGRPLVVFDEIRKAKGWKRTPQGTLRHAGDSL